MSEKKKKSLTADAFPDENAFGRRRRSHPFWGSKWVMVNVSRFLYNEDGNGIVIEMTGRCIAVKRGKNENLSKKS